MHLLPADLAKVWKRELFLYETQTEMKTPSKNLSHGKMTPHPRVIQTGTVLQRLVTHQPEQAMGAVEGGKLLEGME